MTFMNPITFLVPALEIDPPVFAQKGYSYQYHYHDPIPKIPHHSFTHIK